MPSRAFFHCKKTKFIKQVEPIFKKVSGNYFKLNAFKIKFILTYQGELDSGAHQHTFYVLVAKALADAVRE